MRTAPPLLTLAILAACTSSVPAADLDPGEPSSDVGDPDIEDDLHDDTDTGEHSATDTDTDTEPMPLPANIVAHDGYWVSSLLHTPNGGAAFPVTVVNDQHVDPVTGRFTVYSQATSPTPVVVLSPPQVEPGACQEDILGYACAHPNAVYLNGSGQELATSDGTGSWWVKHSWIIDGEGYRHCPLFPAQETYTDCFDAEGVLLADGSTVQVGALGTPTGTYEERRPLVGPPLTYEVETFAIDSQSGTMASLRVLSFECFDEPSAFDGIVRPCAVTP